MIEKLKSVLGKEYVVKEEQLGIEVYRLTNYGVDQETYMKIKKYVNTWTLYEVQRGESFELYEVEDYNTAMLALYISVKGKFEQLALDNSVKEKLRSMSNETEQLQNILEANVESKYFSLIDKKMGAINLYKTGEKYDVVYLNPMKEKIWISKERKLPHAVVIVYNFSSKLQEFDKLIESVDIEKALSAIEIESLKRIYIGK